MKRISKVITSVVLALSLVGAGPSALKTNVDKATTVSAACSHNCRWFVVYGTWNCQYTDRITTLSSSDKRVEEATKNYTRINTIKCVNCNRALRYTWQSKSCRVRITTDFSNFTRIRVTEEEI